MKNHARSFFLSEESFSMNVCDGKTVRACECRTVMPHCLFELITRSHQQILCYLSWCMRHNINWKTLEERKFSGRFASDKIFVAFPDFCHRMNSVLQKNVNVHRAGIRLQKRRNPRKTFLNHDGFIIHGTRDSTLVTLRVEVTFTCLRCLFFISQNEEKCFRCHHKNSPRTRKV